MGLPVPVIPLELPSYQRKENFGCDEAFLQLARALAKPMARTEAASCNILGPTALGFRHRDDAAEIAGLLREMGVAVNMTGPMGASPADIARMGAAHFNVLLSRNRRIRRPLGRKGAGPAVHQDHPHRHPRHPRLHRGSARAFRQHRRRR
jgi:nitrogenase molybdenum-iron protein alpha/beta subunit